MSRQSRCTAFTPADGPRRSPERRSTCPCGPEGTEGVALWQQRRVNIRGTDCSGPPRLANGRNLPARLHGRQPESVECSSTRRCQNSQSSFAEGVSVGQINDSSGAGLLLGLEEERVAKGQHQEREVEDIQALCTTVQLSANNSRGEHDKRTSVDSSVICHSCSNDSCVKQYARYSFLQ